MTSSAKTPKSSYRMTGYSKSKKRKNTTWNLETKIFLSVIGGLLLLAVFFTVNAFSRAQSPSAGQYAYEVASPGVGQIAPNFSLPASNGSTFSLDAYRGQKVLLYFHEGIGCESCWTQMQDIDQNLKDFQNLGIKTIVAITTDPQDAIKQKLSEENISMVTLSDAQFNVSLQYNANEYGMMSGSRDGHTFILVGPDGKIQWRADYGGPPNYTMYVPIQNITASIKAATNGK